MSEMELDGLPRKITGDKITGWELMTCMFCGGDVIDKKCWWCTLLQGETEKRNRQIMQEILKYSL